MENFIDPSFLVDIRKLAEPRFEDNLASVEISEAQFQLEAQKYKSALLGRISFLPKADRLSIQDLKDKLARAWNLLVGWDLIFLGKGYYVIKFLSEITRRKIWAQGHWNLHPGTFRVTNWESDFNPYTQISLKTKVWIRLHISVEYWHPHNLLEIAKAVGNPLRIDRATIDKSNGQYARVLVEIDLNETLTTDIQIMRPGYSFWIKVWYERLPEVCERCLNIGHSIEQCKRKHANLEIHQSIPKQNVHTVFFRKGGSKSKNSSEVIRQTGCVPSLNMQSDTVEPVLSTNGEARSEQTESEFPRAVSKEQVIQVKANISNLAQHETQAIHQTAVVQVDTVVAPQSDLASPSAAEKVFTDVVAEMPLVTNEELKSDFIGVVQSSPAKTYARVVLASKDINVGKICESPYSGLPSPQEVRDKVLGSGLHIDLRNKEVASSSSNSELTESSLRLENPKDISDKIWKQIESDLKVIEEAMNSDQGLEQSKTQPFTVVDTILQSPSVIKTTDLLETEMESLVTLKSRSMKQFSNKKKHIRNKVKVSLSKNKHNYSLRGISGALPVPDVLLPLGV